MNLKAIRKLVGPVTEQELRYVDCFVGEHLGIFLPVGGACYYALSPLHSHPSYMFTLPFDDQTLLKIDGKVIRSEPGRVNALSPEIPHQELPSDSPPRYIAILIDKGLFEEQLGEYKLQNIIFQGEFHDTRPGVLAAVKKFMIEADNEIPGRAMVLRALSVELCHEIIRCIFNIEPRNDRVTNRMEIDRVIEFVNSNLDRKITLLDMAGVANVSPSHFSRIFKAETGVTPVNYLNGVRLGRAKKLLSAGEKTVTEIALECGFGTPSYLSAIFRKKYKLTPSQFQKGLK